MAENEITLQLHIDGYPEQITTYGVYSNANGLHTPNSFDGGNHKIPDLYTYILESIYSIEISNGNITEKVTTDNFKAYLYDDNLDRNNANNRRDLSITPKNDFKKQIIGLKFFGKDGQELQIPGFQKGVTLNENSDGFYTVTFHKNHEQTRYILVTYQTPIIPTIYITGGSKVNLGWQSLYRDWLKGFTDDGKAVNRHLPTTATRELNVLTTASKNAPVRFDEVKGGHNVITEKVFEQSDQYVMTTGMNFEVFETTPTGDPMTFSLLPYKIDTTTDDTEKSVTTKIQDLISSDPDSVTYAYAPDSYQDLLTSLRQESDPTADSSQLTSFIFPNMEYNFSVTGTGTHTVDINALDHSLVSFQVPTDGVTVDLRNQLDRIDSNGQEIKLSFSTSDQSKISVDFVDNQKIEASIDTGQIFSTKNMSDLHVTFPTSEVMPQIGTPLIVTGLTDEPVILYIQSIDFATGDIVIGNNSANIL